MTSRDFCFWLQGFFELRGEDAAPITPAQTVCIQKHLALVFAHEIDPSAGGAAEQGKLNAIHNPPAADAGGLTEEQVKKLIKDQANDSPVKPHSHPYKGPPVMRC